MRGRRFRTFLAAASLVGCELLTGESPQQQEPQPEPQPAPTKQDVGEAAPEIAEQPKLPLVKATKKLYFPVTTGGTLGFKISVLSDLKALAADLELPDFGAPSKADPALLRDDDMLTAWACTPGKDKRCAIGLHFKADAEVKALRIVSNAGRLRVHTQEGFADAVLRNADRHQYLILGKPVTTRNLILEVLENQGGTGKAVRVAEFEAYGLSGIPRQPWEIDPDAAYVVSNAAPWKKGSEWTTRPVFVHTVGPKGGSKRFIQGSALLGRPGDRLLLLERIDSGKCDRVRGTYALIDTHTRVVAPLGELGGPGGSVYSRNDGLGFGVGMVAEAVTVLYGVELDGGKYVRKRTPARQDKIPANVLTDWGLTPEPLPRGGSPPTGFEAPPELTKQKAKVIWLRRLGDSVLAEAAVRGTTRLFRIRPDALEPLEPHSSLALRPPPPCRKTDNARFPNPHTPQWD